ncbi:MAG: thioredoxin domain-containing protein [Xanthomonadales bacterium]|nr:thioredoxin domain-containing protein [Xanthomonadales bacterium]
MQLRILNSGVFERLLRVGLVVLFFMLCSVPDLLAESYGVKSTNVKDQPPIMNPDIASRSTDPDRPPAYGPEDAKVRVIIFSDYQCIHCRRASQATHQISAEFPGEVRIEVWHRALSMHKKAETAALAAVAAQQQGKFWEMHDMIFSSPSTMELSDLERYAQELDLNMDQFRADMNNPDTKERILQESALAEALGARATPGFLINGKVYVGWGSWKSFRRKVERELAAANVLAEQGMDPAEIQYERAFENNTESESFELYRTAVLLPAGAPGE